MGADVQIIVNGLTDEHAKATGEVVAGIVRTLDENDDILDLRRMHKIIITTDFAGALNSLTAETKSGDPITYTNEEYAFAVAKINLLPDGDDFKIVPVINASIVNAAFELSSNGSVNYIQDQLKFAVHLFHHELFHVHDDNKKIDALREVMLNHRYVGKEMYIRPLAEVVWSEYFANRMSAPTVDGLSQSYALSNFTDAIERTKTLIDEEISMYRHHADLHHLIDAFQRHGEFLVKSAAYLLGYVDGLGKSLAELFPEAAEKLNDSYFELTWESMHEVLQAMFEKYPGNWKDLSIYDGLAQAMDEFYASMGIVLSTTDEGGIYADIPWR